MRRLLERFHRWLGFRLYGVNYSIEERTVKVEYIGQGTSGGTAGPDVKRRGGKVELFFYRKGMSTESKPIKACEGQDCPIKNHCKLGLTAFLVSYYTVSYVYDTTIGPDGLARGCSEFVEIEKR